MENPLTSVSGYWIVKNKHNNNYVNEWFKNSLAIVCPYVFFGNKESIDLVKQCRGDLPTHYIECEIKDFYTYKYKDKILTDPVHCPSAELNLIWNEKIFLIEKAAKLNPFQSEYFAWIDAGICEYRDKTPPQTPFNNQKISCLPKNKIIFSSSSKPFFQPGLLNTNNYHHVCGTSYILHKNIINIIISLYKEKLDDLVNINKIYTDQVILTHIFNENAELFYKLADGYGKVIPLLY